MVERWKNRVSEGMTVKGSDGEELGKIVACQPNGLVVEKGLLFTRDLVIPYERIADLRGGEVVLSLVRAELAAPASADVGGNGHAVRGVLDQFGEIGEILVPLVEEEILATKHVERVGEVHVRKEIITEEKQITVPVTREVLRVERVPVSHEVRAGDRPFVSESYDILIREEHVTLEKRAVVHEELRVGKEIEQAEETASTTVRRERAEIEMTGTIRRAEAPVNDTLRATGTGGAKR